MNHSEPLLFLATSLIGSGTFWWNYVRTGAGRNFGRTAESWAFLGYLAVAVALPLLSVVVLSIGLQIAINSIGRVFFLAILFQGQWLCSKRLFARMAQMQSV